jgi:hypothetical protein
LSPRYNSGWNQHQPVLPGLPCSPERWAKSAE